MPRKNNLAQNCVIGVDVGSSKISAVVAELLPDKRIEIRGRHHGISSGLKRGWVSDVDELAKAIDRVVDRAQTMAGIRSQQVVSNVPLSGTRFLRHSGFVLPKSEGTVLSEMDKVEAIRRSKNVQVSSDETLMHTVPLIYKVDGKTVENPVGLHASNLEVQTGLVFGFSESISHLRHAYRSLNYRVAGLVFDLMSLSHVVLSDEERRVGTLLMDIGGRFTKVGLFKDGALHNSVVIPIGGETLTSDLSQCLDVSIPEAERLKISRVILESTTGKDDDIPITSKSGERKSVLGQLLCQIVEARLKELMAMVDRAMGEDISRAYSIVLSGGSSALPGLDAYVMRVFDKSTRTGLANASLIDDDPTYALALGSVMVALHLQAVQYPEQSTLTAVFKKLLGRL